MLPRRDFRVVVVFCISTVASSLGFRLQAMDRWAALSQVESGDNDRAVGRNGEVSRYQIKPDIWRKFAPPRANWRSAQISLGVAQRAMSERCTQFERRFHRPPTDFEFYVLWNAPAQVTRPTRTVYLRAWRFVNLLQSAPPFTGSLQAERAERLDSSG